MGLSPALYNGSSYFESHLISLFGIKITTEDEDNTVEEDVDVVVNMPEDKRAPVWRYFSKTEEDKNKAECSLCQTKVSINNSSTSMMKLHIERNHQKVYKNELAGLIEARKDEFKL